MAESWQQFLRMLSAHSVEAADGAERADDVQMQDIQAVPLRTIGPVSLRAINNLTSNSLDTSLDICRNPQQNSDVYPQKNDTVQQNEALRKTCEQLNVQCDRLFRENRRTEAEAEEAEAKATALRDRMKIEKDLFNVISDDDLRTLATETSRAFGEASNEKKRLHSLLRQTAAENLRLHLLHQSYLEELREVKEVLKSMRQFVVSHQGGFVEFQGCHAEGDVHSADEDADDEDDDESDEDYGLPFHVLFAEDDSEEDGEDTDDDEAQGPGGNHVVGGNAGNGAPEAGDHVVQVVDGPPLPQPQGGAEIPPPGGLPLVIGPAIPPIANNHEHGEHEGAELEAAMPVADEPAQAYHPLVATLSLSSRESYQTASSTPSGAEVRRDRARERHAFEYYSLKPRYQWAGAASSELHLLVDGINVLDHRAPDDFLEPEDSFSWTSAYKELHLSEEHRWRGAISEIYLPEEPVGLARFVMEHMPLDRSCSDSALPVTFSDFASEISLHLVSDGTFLSEDLDLDLEDEETVEEDRRHTKCLHKCCCSCQ